MKPCEAKRRSCILLVLFLVLVEAVAQGSGVSDTLRVMFYNAENLFDCEDDSLKDDSEYLPGGAKGWTPSRYWAKLSGLARVMAAVGDYRLPGLVGLCEVENDHVLSDLVGRTPLRTAGYRFLLTSSPDERGVDVALLYLPSCFRPLSHRSVTVAGGPRPTRDILHVSGLLPTADTLDVIVCHLPSRYGGAKASAPFRRLAAQTLRGVVDSVCAVRHVPRVLVMGDFNDELQPSSMLSEALGVEVIRRGAYSPVDTSLYRLLSLADGGSYVYRGHWELIDHLLVSGRLLHRADGCGGVVTGADYARVVRLPFLLQDDEAFGGQKPFRTHLGGRYLGGYSDHLPLAVDLLLDF